MKRSQIIKDLASSQCDLYTSLKRTKVLLQLIADEKILDWVNSELKGYSDEDTLPEYRLLKGDFFGSYTIGTFGRALKYSNVSIPLGKMPIDERNDFLSAGIRQGISTLEQMLKNDKVNFSKPIPADLYRKIESQYINNPFFYIVSGNVIIDKMDVINIIPKVENKLLDILLLLENEFGNLDELDIDLGSKSKDEIEKIYQNLYVIVYNNKSVNVGDNNKLKDVEIASTILDANLSKT